jgi:16S rRNA processing protein RimM
VPGRLEQLKRAQVRLRDGSDVQVDIEEAWTHKGDWVFKFAGVDSIDDAERFAGSDLWLYPADRGTLPDGEFFQSDLVGCAIVDAATGTRLGVVEGWHQYGGPPLMQLQIDGREVLIPFVSSECKVDFAERTIGIDCPEGLLDL